MGFIAIYVSSKFDQENKNNLKFVKKNINNIRGLCWTRYKHNYFERSYARNLFLSFRILRKTTKITWSITNYYPFNEFDPLIILFRPNNFFLRFIELLLESVKAVNKNHETPVIFFLTGELAWQRSFTFLDYFLNYNEIYCGFNVESFYFLKLLTFKNVKSAYHFIWNFKPNNLLFVNLRNVSKKKPKNFSFLSLGFFIKFFEKKKSFKKNKLLKLLIIKYFRKLFVIANLWKLILIIKKNPIFLPELLNLFQQPLFVTVDDPTKENPEKKKKLKFDAPKFIYYFFLENKSFVINKMKKKGRIKRKITKKLVSKNKLVD